VAIPGASGGGGRLREAGDRRRHSYGERASTDGAPELDQRQRRTLDPVVTAVARGAVDFGSGSGGGGSWMSARGDGSQRRAHDVGPRRRALWSGTIWRPPPTTTPIFPMRERQRRTSLGSERWRIDGPVFMLFCIQIYANVNRFYDILSVHGSPSIFCMFMIYIFIHILCNVC
jgi:hypothetical protein